MTTMTTDSKPDRSAAVSSSSNSRQSSAPASQHGKPQTDLHAAPNDLQHARGGEQTSTSLLQLPVRYSGATHHLDRWWAEVTCRQAGTQRPTIYGSAPARAAAPNCKRLLWLIWQTAGAIKAEEVPFSAVNRKR